MRKSVKVRKLIFEILLDICKNNSSYDKSFNKLKNSINLTDQERAMIYNISLNSLRFNFFIINILKLFLKKKTKLKIRILLLSAITQILYLDFKDYAVTNDTVEIAKIKKLNSGLINSVLKNIISKKNTLSLNNFEIEDMPSWFLDNIKNKNFFELKKIILSFAKEPSLHLVFKKDELMKNFKEKNIRTSKKSLFLMSKKPIESISNFNLGDWWVQDFSSMLPIYLSPEIAKKNIIDLCAAPGGKAFQAISMGAEVTVNDINSKRIKILEQNFKRLEFNNKITNQDALKIKEGNKFDIVILDAPCSGIGTIRRNPDILFKEEPPNINQLIKTQRLLITQASNLLKPDGVLIYMVCSFFYKETFEQKKWFLSKNKNFSQQIFKKNKNEDLNRFINNDGDIFCVPSEHKGFLIDGFYAVKFKKI